MRYLLLFLLLTTRTLKAQEFPVRHYATRDGLVHATVYRIYQDKKGFLWFCTDYGLSKFDGRSFRNYTQTEGLTDRTILSVSEDAQEHLLVSTYRNGINLLSDSGIRKLRVGRGHLPEQVAYTLPDGDRLWIVSFVKGNRLFLLKQDSVSELVLRNGAEEVCVNKIRRFGREILFPTSGGLYRLNPDGIPEPFLKEALGATLLYDVEKDRHGHYWAGGKDILLQLSEGRITARFPCKGIVSDLLADRHNNLWVATDNGDVLLVRNGQAENITERLKIPRTFVTDLFEDHEGNIWLATQGIGVFRVSSLNILNYPAQRQVISIYCNAITPVSDTEIWTGSFGALSSWKAGHLRALKSSLAASEFVYFVRRQGDDVYIGTPHRLIRKSTHPPYAEKSFPVRGAISFCIDHDSTLLIGSYKSLYRLREEQLHPIDPDGLLGNRRVNSLTPGPQGSLWISTDSGVVFRSAGHYQYLQLPGYSFPLRANQLLADSRGNIWLSTRLGLVCYHEGRFRHFSTANGLNGNSCRELFEDSTGHLWVSTLQGLNRIDLRSMKAEEFVAHMDLPEITALCRHHNLLFIGTIEGLTVLDTRERLPEQQTLPVYITQLRTAQGVYPMPSSVRLPYDDNNVRIDFAAVHFGHPERVEYRYRIGPDSSWHLTRNNSVELPALPGGHYRFVLNARLDKGAWSKDIVLPIVIATPFWQSWWFLALCLLLLSVLLFLLVKRSILRKERKKKNRLMLLNRVAYLKQQALSALINPHFIFNCMNSIQHYLNRKDYEQATHSLSEFADLIRMTLEDTQEAFISLSKELGRIRLYLSLEQLRIGNKMDYEITTAPGVCCDDIRIPNMILQPYIENAIWHGLMPKKGKGKISLHFSLRDEGLLQVCIRDDGNGFRKGTAAATEGHRSMGMQLTEMRLNLLNRLLNDYYTVSVSSLDEGSASGTQVTLLLPCHPHEQQLQVLEAEMNSLPGMDQTL